jgi:hypothetical protein
LITACLSKFVEGKLTGVKSDKNSALWIPSDPQETAKVHVDWDKLRKERTSYFNPRWDDESLSKWRLLRKPKIPEPASENIEYAPDQMRLVDRFRQSGLQIIVKMASVELTPDQPELPTGGWHVSFIYLCVTHLLIFVRWKAK